MALNYLAPAPYASFVTRNGAFQADANALVSNVGAGAQALDLLEVGCVPLAFNPFANFRNLIDGGDFSINPFQRNIAGLASGGVITTPIAATPTYFADRFFAAGGASSAILMAAVADASVARLQPEPEDLAPVAATPALRRSTSGRSSRPSNSLRCQGQTVTLSFWARAGATYSGGALDGAGRRGQRRQPERREPASPEPGPRRLRVVNAQQTLTTAMTRYQFTGVVPANTTQLGVLLSFTPSGTAGADDSIVDQRRAARDRSAAPRPSSASTPRSCSRSASATPGRSRSRRRAS